MPVQFFQTLLTTVYNETGIKKSKIESVVKASESQIKHMNDLEAKKQLTILLPMVAQEYGARHEIHRNIIAECIRLIMRKFNFISVSEIREAYREYTSGELNVKGADTYGGEFNVSQMGKILTAYCENRRKVLAEFIKQRDLISEEIQNTKKKKAAIEKFEIDFPKIVLSKRKEITTWSDVPEWWYNSIKKRNWIAFEEGEAAEIFEQAKKLAEIRKKEYEKEKKVKALSGIIDLSSCQTPQAIARKLTVFKKVVQDSSWHPVNRL